MTDRRNLLLGGGALAAAALSSALKPRRYISLMGGAPLSRIVPRNIGNWQSRDVSDLLDAKNEESLMDRLYEQTIERIYTNSGSATEIMMLFAHGDSQTNDLQLHRPEVCYPAFGMQITHSEVFPIPLNYGAFLPARSIVASGASRVESIIYWTRLGDYLPTSGSSQRFDRLKESISGRIADGLLARLSMSNVDQSTANATMGEFIRDLISVCPAKYLPALVGSPLALRLTAK